MSLNWSISDVRDYEQITITDLDDRTIPREVHQEGLKTEALVFLTMGIGMNKITEDNEGEFFSRVDMWESVSGTMLRLGPERERYYLTYEDVHRRVGLGTNASNLTKAAFHKKLIEQLRQHAVYGIKRKVTS